MCAAIGVLSITSRVGEPRQCQASRVQFFIS